MTPGRLIRFAAMTALASGVLSASIVARAREIHDPAQVIGSGSLIPSKPSPKKKTAQARKPVGATTSADEARLPTLLEAPATEVEKPSVAQGAPGKPRPIPLPPHRPEGAGGGDLAVAIISPEARAAGMAENLQLPKLASYSSPNPQRFEPYVSSLPAFPVEAPKLETAKDGSAKDSVPVLATDARSVPLPPVRPFLVASIDNGEGGMPGVAPAQTNEVAVEATPSIMLTQVPLPPMRPGFPEDTEQAAAPASGVQLSSYQQTPVQENSSDSKSASWLERLFNAPSGSGDAASEAEDSPRRLSKLNRIIGDDPARASSLKPLIRRHAAENGVPFGLADAVVRIESRYNSKARNGPYMGLMQIHHRTAASLGYSGDASGLLDPDTNLLYGIKYLAIAYRLAGGDTCGTILRYQAGHRATSMTSAARHYCSKVKMIHAELTR